MAAASLSQAGAEWLVTVASVTGPRHVRSGLPNQDRWVAHQIDGRAQVLAVADGAGSRKRSDRGAGFAVGAARDAATEVFGGAALAGIEQWRGAVGAFARACVTKFDRRVAEATQEIRRSSPGLASREVSDSFATTLLAVVVAPPYLGFFSVGDCFLVVDRAPGGPFLLVNAPERDHAGATVFLTSRIRDQYMEFGVVADPAVRALALCSDGLAEAMLDSRQAVDGRSHYLAPPEFGRYFDRFSDPGVGPRELADRLASADFAATSGDDKTIVMAVRRP